MMFFEADRFCISGEVFQFEMKIGLKNLAELNVLFELRKQNHTHQLMRRNP
jgi:hypothetical protein